MKTYVLMLAKYFPLYHYRAGKETGFKDKLLEGKKIHTIRSNYPLWSKRIKEVQTGEALISIRQWAGKPYKSKQIEIAKLFKENRLGIESFIIPEIGELATVLDHYEGIDSNDGLSRLDWMNWFEHYERNKELAIIHFTDFRYSSSKQNEKI